MTVEEARAYGIAGPLEPHCSYPIYLEGLSVDHAGNILHSVSLMKGIVEDVYKAPELKLSSAWDLRCRGFDPGGVDIDPENPNVPKWSGILAACQGLKP